MKRVLIAVLIGVASMSSISAKAQVSISVNIGQQPAWGPTGYDHVDYYYLPDVDAYYYVPGQQYVYLDNGAWVWRNALPSRYSGYDLYKGYKVVMNAPRPYLSHQNHLTAYSKYKNYGTRQAVIRDSRDAKYVNARNGNKMQTTKPVQTRPNQGKPANAGRNMQSNRPGGTVKAQQNNNKGNNSSRPNASNHGRGGR